MVEVWTPEPSGERTGVMVELSTVNVLPGEIFFEIWYSMRRIDRIAIDRNESVGN